MSLRRQAVISDWFICVLNENKYNVIHTNIIQKV